jgi:hypothetical protein
MRLLLCGLIYPQSHEVQGGAHGRIYVGISLAHIHACCRHYCICVIFDCRDAQNTVDTKPQHIGLDHHSASTYALRSPLGTEYLAYSTDFNACIQQMRAPSCIAHSGPTLNNLYGPVTSEFRALREIRICNPGLPRPTRRPAICIPSHARQRRTGCVLRAARVGESLGEAGACDTLRPGRRRPTLR